MRAVNFQRTFAPVSVSIAAVGRIVVGALLAIAAIKILFQMDAPHITMCMLGALGFAGGLLLLSHRWAPLLASFWFGWILFYTVYTASTFLAIELYITNSGELNERATAHGEAWIYHTLIHFVMLLLFVCRLDRMRIVCAGFAAALLAAPAMFLLRAMRGEFWTFEPAGVVVAYFILGIVLAAILYRANRADEHSRWRERVKVGVIVSLAAYCTVFLIPFLAPVN